MERSAPITGGYGPDDDLGRRIQQSSPQLIPTVPFGRSNTSRRQNLGCPISSIRLEGAWAGQDAVWCLPPWTACAVTKENGFSTKASPQAGELRTRGHIQRRKCLRHRQRNLRTKFGESRGSEKRGRTENVRPPTWHHAVQRT
jgi:hypothetical protein